jgi:hypothetical protein
VTETAEEVVDIEQLRRDHASQQRAVAYAHAVNCPVDVREAAAAIVDSVFSPKI